MTPEEFLQLCKQKNNIGFDQLNDYIKNKGVFKSISDELGLTPLHIAVKAKNDKIVKLLIDNGMNPMTKDKTQLSKTPLVIAIQSGFLEIALMLLNSKRFKPISTKKRFNEYTALGKNTSYTIMEYKTLLKTLIESGLDAEPLDDQGLNIITRAIQNNNIEQIKVCVSLGININNPERLPLKFALYKEPANNEIIKLLINNGAKISIKGNDTWEQFNALHTAHYRDNFEIFEFLILNYNSHETIDEELLKEIIAHKEVKFLKLIWNIPLVHDYIIQHKLYNALPSNIQDIFIF